MKGPVFALWAPSSLLLALVLTSPHVGQKSKKVVCCQPISLKPEPEISLFNIPAPLPQKTIKNTTRFELGSHLEQLWDSARVF